MFQCFVHSIVLHLYFAITDPPCRLQRGISAIAELLVLNCNMYMQFSTYTLYCHSRSFLAEFEILYKFRSEIKTTLQEVWKKSTGYNVQVEICVISYLFASAM